MTSNNKFNCYIIGEESLTIQCAQLLKQANQSILGIITNNEALEIWANEHDIPTCADFSLLEQTTEYDYLFSIVNARILPEEIIRRPRYFAVNYHDSLLPRYAGVHATSWSILNNEKQHGISWHIITEQVDAGDILKQAHFTIDPLETALSLNLKCYEQALYCFAELIKELATHTYTRITQDLSQRTYYGYRQKPVGAWIDWMQPAEDLDRICRALNFGDYPNRLSSTVFLHKNQIFIVDSIRATNRLSTAIPGTIIAIDDTCLCIATGSYEVELLSVRTFSGKKLSFAQLAQQYQIQPDICLLSPNLMQQQEFAAYCQQLAQQESFWANELVQIEPTNIPFLPTQTVSNAIDNAEIICMDTYTPTSKLLNALSDCLSSFTTKSDLLLTACLIYLYRSNQNNKISVRFNYPELLPEDKFIPIISQTIPLIVDLHKEDNFNQILEIVIKQQESLIQKGPYLTDITFRYPKLKKLKLPPITLVVIKDSSGYKPDSHQMITFAISQQGALQTWVNKQVLEPNLKAVLANIAGHIKTILQGVSNNPQLSISCLPLLTAREYQQIVVDWNQTTASYSKEKTVYQLFEEQVEKTPNSIAVTFREENLTYQELNQRSNQIAHYLIALGLKPNQYVVANVNRDIDLIMAMLGIIKAGGIYVPIDTQQPLSRLKHIINDCQANILITNLSPKLYRTLSIEHILQLNNIKKRLDKYSLENPSICIPFNAPIYVNYTSGSTGEPKGVEIPHIAVNRLVINSNYIEFSTNDIIAQLSNISFDAATFEIWGALLNGCHLVILEPDLFLSEVNLEKAITKYKISIMWLTSALFNHVIFKNASTFKFLKTLIVGGEALDIKAIRKLFEADGKPRNIINGYGPTENTTFTTYYPIKSLPEKLSSIPIGKPITGTEVYVINEQLQPVPIGVIGELCISGIGLAHGYINKPELTQQKFISNPFSCDPQSKLYLSGDLVRWLPDGNLDYIGRKDSQVKIRGFRIELTEIQQHLVNHQAIDQALIIPSINDSGEKQLIAYITLIKKINAEKPIATAQLQNFLKSLLPDYMIPTAFYQVKNFPLTSNGKIDRKKLLKMPFQPLPVNLTFSPALDQLQKSLVKIWENVLRITPIGIEDDFFALGGDSIIALQIMAKAKEQGIEFSVSQLFQHSTIKQLTKIAKRKRTSQKQKTVYGKCSLTPIQHWFFKQNLPQPQSWSQACFIKLDPGINTNYLKQTLQHLTAYHDAFRLHFKPIEEGWQQYYSENTSEFRLDEIRVTPQIQKSIKWLEAEAHIIQHNFNLSKGPLFGGRIYSNDNSQPEYLLLVIHHLLIDGISWRILLEDLQHIYQQIEKTLPVNLPSKGHSFKDWAKQLQQTDISAQEQNYWLEQNLVHTNFLLPYAQPVKDDFASTSICIETALSFSLTNKLLQQVPRTTRIQPQEILLTGLVHIISQWLHQPTILLHLENHGRDALANNLDITRTMGWFTTLFPIALNCSGISLQNDLYHVKEQLNKIPQKGIGYGILRYLNKDSTIQTLLKQQVQPKISFNYWGQFDQIFNKESKFTFSDLHLVSHPENKRPHELEIDCAVKSGKLTVYWRYSANYFKHEIIQQLSNNYLQIINDLLESCLKQSHMCLDKQFTPLPGQQVKLKFDYINEASYPLSPMQQGILYHCLLKPNQGTYLVQLNGNIKKELNIPLLREAWQLTINHHPILRTYFSWQTGKQPLQIVAAKVELPWLHHDLSALSKKMQEQQLNILLHEDRKLEFNLEQAPLMRITLLKLQENSYQLIWSMHHIIIDGWCLPVILKEVQNNYIALVNQKQSNLTNFKPYADYIDWLQQQNLIAAKQFWQNYLEGYTTPSYFTHAYSQAEVSPDYAMDEKILAAPVTQQLVHYAKQHKLTLSTLFQGAWAILLHRYCQLDDIVFGATVAGRPLELSGCEYTLGVFINTLPIRMQFNKTISVVSCLQHIQNNLMSSLPYSYTPLTEIQTCSDLQSNTELFNSIVVFENYPQENEKQSLLNINEFTIWEPTHYPVNFVIIPKNNTLTLKVNYNKNCLPEGGGERLLSHLNTLLLEMLHKPQQMIYELNLIPPYEQKLLVKWTQSANNYYSNESLHILFEQQVEKTPQKTAIIFDNLKLTYAELNSRANQLAHYLHKKKLQKEELVALYLEPSLEMIIAILGIFKAGGAYVPLDPKHPLERIQYVLTDCQARFVLAKTYLSKSISNADILADFINIDTESSIWQGPVTDLGLKTNLNNLAYTIYTSGSTGQPKGVMVEHQSLSNFIQSIQTILNAKPNDCFLNVTSLSFDISILELFLPLTLGATCVITVQEDIYNSNKLNKILTKNSISFIQTTPSIWSILIKLNDIDFSSLTLLSGGEVLTMTLAKHLLSRGTRLINLYGPTEATIWATSYEFNSNNNEQITPVPIGKPISNVQTYVLDKYLQPVPIGIPGELHLGGICLARGYLNQPELTEEKFISHPFRTNDRLYKTGDKVCWLPDGNLLYLGRLDDQIKIRGQRTEPSEIEAALLKNSSITQCVVTAQFDHQGNNILIAYIVEKPNFHNDNDSLKQQLAQTLPDYMIPSLFIRLDSLPLTTSGKINRQALLKPDFKNLHDHHVLVKPNSEIEHYLAALWQDILGKKQISTHDNFFNLGGHSLTALQVISNISKQFTTNISISDFLKNPTIAQLAALIDAKKLENKAVINFLDRAIPSPLVLLQPQGNKLPLFFIHPVGGTIFWFAHLANYLTKDRPFYGLQDPGITAGETLFNTMEELASFYLTAIRSIQPKGPYYIGGASFGATAAIEIAKQLEQQDEHVTFIGLLDGWAFYPETLLQKDYFAEIMQQQHQKIRDQFKDKQLDNADSWLALQCQREQILNQYRLPNIKSKLTLFKSETLHHVFEGIDNPYNHWQHYYKQPITVYHVPGDHETMFYEPNVQTLAKCINECLEKVEQQENIEITSKEFS